MLSNFFCGEIKKLPVPISVTVILFLVLISVIALVVIVALGVFFYKQHKQKQRRKKAVSSHKNGAQEVPKDMTDDEGPPSEFSDFEDGHGPTVPSDLISKHDGTPALPSDLADGPGAVSTIPLDLESKHAGISTVPLDLESKHAGVSTIPLDLESRITAFIENGVLQFPLNEQRHASLFLLASCLSIFRFPFLLLPSLSLPLRRMLLTFVFILARLLLVG
ncbi:hypothetical protein niasHT_024001 [Heterodera trifolii]|uniref:Uncharacterized protein n=1 Tax=Heterodera trifolii TaxID=157864 RepID=A0ABD2KQ18_9BILA